MKILLVDDDRLGIAVRKQLLTTCGYEVHNALTGTEALKLITSREFDLAILDYKLPDVDGLELARRIREMQCDFPLLLLSGQINIPAFEGGLISEALVKGQGAEQLLRVVKELTYGSAEATRTGACSTRR